MGKMLKWALTKHIFSWYQSQTCNTCMYVNFKKFTYMEVLHLCIYTGKKGRILLEELEMGENV